MEGVDEDQKRLSSPSARFQLSSGTMPRRARRGARRAESVGMSLRGSNNSRRTRSFAFVAGLESA